MLCSSVDQPTHLSVIHLGRHAYSWVSLKHRIRQIISNGLSWIITLNPGGIMSPLFNLCKILKPSYSFQAPDEEEVGGRHHAYHRPIRLLRGRVHQRQAGECQNQPPKFWVHTPAPVVSNTLHRAVPLSWVFRKPSIGSYRVQPVRRLS